MRSLLCPSCGLKARSEQARWRPSPGFTVACYWSQCSQQPTTEIMPTLSEARREWREGRVSPSPKKCPACDGRGTILNFDLEPDSKEAVCIVCKGAGKLARAVTQA